jgi:hypothetical protein
MLQSLKLALHLLRYVKSGGKPSWDDSDAIEYSRYMDSYSGKKLWVLLNQMLEHRAVHACSGGGGSFASGKVAGFREAIAVLEYMRMSNQTEQFSSGDESGVASSLIERYRP